MLKRYRLLALILATGLASATVAPAMAISPSVVISADNDDEISDDETSDDVQAPKPRLGKKKRGPAVNDERELSLPPLVIRPPKKGEKLDREDDAEDDEDEDGEDEVLIRPTQKPKTQATPSPTASAASDASTGATTQIASKGSEKFVVAPPTSEVQTSVTEPKSSMDSPAAKTPAGANQSIDPVANVPIQLKNIAPNKKSPADVFVESATVGVAAMAVSAAALGAVALTRGARLRRQAKGEYLYETDN